MSSREPAQVIARVLQRDSVLQRGFDERVVWGGDDGTAVLIDPFHDHRNAFVFATNANGADFDALVSDESPSLNVDWRGVWRVAARRTPEGWSAEFAIPFRTLRYPAGDGSRPWERQDDGTLPPGEAEATLGPRPEVGAAARPRTRHDREPRLRPGGVGPADRQPDPLRAVPAGEARLLPRERGDLRVRHAGSVRAAAMPAFLLAPDRPQAGRG